MSNWKAVYRRKRRGKEDEAFACTGCGVQYEPENRLEGCHTIGPLNNLCSCGMTYTKIMNDAFRENYELIRWEK